LSPIKIGEHVRLLVQPFVRGTVEEIRNGKYEPEAVIASRKATVVTGLSYIRRIKERDHVTTDVG
jgi:hypothetical protein